MKRVRAAEQIQLESPMRCPLCGSAVRCMDSRGGPNNSIRRRRLCMGADCRHRFTTYEIELESGGILRPGELAEETRKRVDEAIALLRPLGDFADAIKKLTATGTAEP